MALRRAGSCLAGSALIAALLAACFDPVAEDRWHRPRDGGEAEPDGGELAGADGGGGEPGCPAVPCRTAGSFASEADLLSFLQVLGWTTVARPTSTCLRASDDLRVSRTLTLKAADVALPASCSGCAGVTFKLSERAEGVTCLDEPVCSALMLSGARFRVRQVLQDPRPVQSVLVPVVEILPPCEAGCMAPEIPCAQNHTCWGDEIDHCRFCRAAPHATCACVGKSETEACRLYLTNDLSCTGTCQEGRCVANPGQSGCP